MSLRLKDLDPQKVARSVIDAVQQHVDRLCRQLDTETFTRNRHLDTSLGGEVVALTTWAQTGNGLNRSRAVSHLLSIYVALYSSADSGYKLNRALPIETLEQVDADRDYGVVILAAQARIRLLLGSNIPLRELAALSSLSVDSFAVGSGKKLKRVSHGVIHCEQARNWLANRGMSIEKENK